MAAGRTVSERVSVGTASLALDRLGSEGDPAVLVHDAPGDRREWSPVLPGLSSALRLLVYDRRGHGASTGPRRAQPVAEDTEDLVGLLRSVDEFPVHVVAHGYGCAVAVRLAESYPETVRSLVLVEAPFVGLSVGPDDEGRPPAPDGPWRQVLDLARRGRHTEAFAAYVRLLGPGSPAPSGSPRGRAEGNADGVETWVAEITDPLASHPPVASLQGVDVPTLAVTGRNVPGELLEATERLARLFPNGSATVLDAGPSLPDAAPAALAGVILSFLLERNVPPA